MKKPPLHIHSFILVTSLISRSKLLTTTFLSFIIIILSAGNVSAQNLINSSKITEYPNGVYKMEPVVFGITEPVRNLPTSVKNAEEKIAAFITKQQREAIRIQMLRDKGIPQDEIQKDEINRLNAKIIKKILSDEGAGLGSFLDPLVNRNKEFNLFRNNLMPAPGLTFDGATQLDNAAQGIGAVHPPDVNGDVGLNHYVSSVNLVYKIFNKNGTVAAGPFKTSDLFSGLPPGDPCRVNNDGDPIVVYDPLADRWHISQFALTGGTNCQCAAVSVTGDPTGAYYVWRYNYPNNLLNDYPKVGVWLDAYHMTFNQFNNAGTAFLGMGILSQDRPKALAGDPNTSVVYTNIATIDPSAGGGLPADIDGLVPPPAGMAEVIAEFRADEFGDPNDAIRYYRWVPNFITPGSSSISVLPDVVLAPFDARNPSTRLANEVSGGANLDAISDRLMHRFAYRNLGTQAIPVNSFVGNFSVNVSGVNPTTAGTFQTGIRWFEMRRTADVFSVFDQGTHNLTPGNGATGLNNWMGSIAQDNKGNLALGFSQSSTTQRADIKIAGRTNNVLNSGILNEGEALFFAANGSQTNTSGRWGDYSSMNIDPVDGCTFWYTQEYYAATTSTGWSTRVGNFILPGCTPEEKATIQGTITFCSGGAPINGATVNATGGFVRVTGAPGTYSMTVSPGTYTVSANKEGGFFSNNAAPATVSNGQIATVDLCLSGFPVLAATTVSLISESCLPANGVIDPGETVTVAFGVQNSGAENTVNDVGTLQATGGVTIPGASQNYGIVVVGGASVSRNFTFTADPAMLCGANITATIEHVDGATNLGSLTYILPTGLIGAPVTISYSGPPVAIPDNVPAGVNIVLPVSGVIGAIADLNFRLDAIAGCAADVGNASSSVTHTFNADLNFKLTSPGGTTVALINNRGGAGNNFCNVLLNDEGGFPAASTITTAGAVAGNFKPESPLSAFDGEDANGNWTLNVSDIAGDDLGTLNRFSLIFSGTTCCVTPLICDITNVSFLNIGSCNNNGTNDPSDDYFTADIKVDFINPPVTGSLQIEPDGDALGTNSIVVGSLVGNTHTFTGVQFKADGTPTVVEAEFTIPANECTQTLVGPTVQSCSPVCDITNVSFQNIGPCNDNGTIDLTDDYFTADVKVDFINPPAIGSLQIEPGGDALGTNSIAVGSLVGNTHTFTGVQFKADGTPTVVEAEFTIPANLCVLTEIGPTVQACSLQPCTNISFFGSANINPFGLVKTISTCSFAGEFSTINGAVAGQTLKFTSSVVTDFITIHTGSFNGPVIAFGTTPLIFANTFTGTIFAHWNTPDCGFQSTCRTTKVQCTSCDNCIITCPADIITNSTTDECGAIVLYPIPTITGNCGGVTATPPSGSFFPIGTTTVNVSSQAEKTCSFTIKVEDHQAPVISCPASIGLCGGNQVVNYTLPTATDNCSAIVAQTSGLPSGSLFTVGTTINTYTATDPYGNSSSCSFNVVINPIPVVNAVSNQTYCAGDIVPSTVFGSSVPGTTFLWIRTAPLPDIGLGATSNTGNVPSFTATNTSTAPITSSFSVVAFYTNGGVSCTSTPLEFSITVNPKPLVNTVANLVYCAGSIVPSVLFSSPVAGATFNWSRTIPAPDIGLGPNNGNVNVPSFTSVNASAVPTVSTFSYTASYTNNSVTCTGPPKQFTITINPAPLIPGPISGLASVCRNQSGVTYCVTPVVGVASYNWTLPYGASVIGSATGSCITLKFSSKFKGGPLCVSAGGCVNGPNTCKTISVISGKPNVPVSITGPSTLCPLASGNYSIVAVPNATSYTWTGTGGLSIISGQGTIAVVVKAPAGFINGSVKVKAVNCNGNNGDRIKNLGKGAGCRITTDDLTSDPGVALQALSALTVYPNPTSGKAIVTFISDRKANFSLKVVDMIGKVLISRDVSALEGYNEKEINLENVAKGVYFITIQGEGTEVQTIRIVVD